VTTSQTTALSEGDILRLEGKTLILGKPSTRYQVDDCTFFDSFYRVTNTEKHLFSVSSFAQTQNKERTVSLQLSYCYKILAIVVDHKGASRKSYAWCQYYRSAKDNCVEAFQGNNPCEVLRTSIIERVFLKNFLNATVTYEGLKSVPKEDPNKDHFFQYRFFNEETSQLETEFSDTYNGELRLDGTFRDEYGARYHGIDFGDITQKAKTLLGKDIVLPPFTPGPNPNPTPTPKNTKADQPESNRKRPRSLTLEESGWKISPAFQAFVTNKPFTVVSDISPTDRQVLLAALINLKDNALLEASQSFIVNN